MNDDPRDERLIEAERADSLAKGYRDHAEHLIRLAREEEARSRGLRTAAAAERVRYA